MHPDWQNKQQQYCELHSDEEPLVLRELTTYTWKKTINPRQLSGHLQGRLLALLVALQNPKNMLEIGSFTGYSTYCLWENAPKDCHFISIEADAEIAYKRDQFWKNHELWSQIEWRTTDGLSEMDELPKQDIIFIDADKNRYKEYFIKGLQLLKSNGIMIFDNTLWSGKVLEKAASKDKDTKLMQEFNQFIAQEQKASVTLLPIRDGLSIIRKH
ncbi:MAG: O-methyltransferase [Bacteroidia bacterium]